MEKISIVIPIYNEQELLFLLYRRLKASLEKDFSQFDHEIIFVDDGSYDQSPAILDSIQRADPSVGIILFSRNFGHHLAISAGLDYALGDYVVLMDGDLQDQPEEIKRLYDQLQKGFDVVYGEQRERHFSLFKRLCSKIFVCVVRFLIAEEIVINSYIFRIMRKNVVHWICQIRERQRYVVGIIGWVGFKHSSVLVEHASRTKGKTKYTIKKQMRLAMDAIFSFSDYPLRLITRLGLSLVCITFLSIGYLFFRKIVWGMGIIGWTSMMVLIMFASGIQLFVIGIIGEYVGRMYVEVKQRPLYIIRTIQGLCDVKERNVDRSIRFSNNRQNRSQV